MFCPKCGQEVTEGAAFCGHCGAKLHGASAPESAPSNSGISANAAPAQAPTATNTPQMGAAAPQPKKKRSKKPLVIVLILVVLLAAGGFAAWQLLAPKGNEQQPVSAQTSQSGNEPGAEVYEDFTVGAVTYTNDGDLGPRLEMTVTNNTENTLLGADFSVEGTFGIIDEYGDEGSTTDDLDLTCWTPGSFDGISYLQPGDNNVVLIPSDDSGVVATYTPEQGDTQEITLADVENFEVEVSDGERLSSNAELLTPQDCDLDITLNPDGSVSGSLTNNSDDRWRSVTVYMRFLDTNGMPYAGYGSRYSAFDSLKVAEYVKPDASDDFEFSVNSDIAEIEALYVIVQKDV